MRRSLHALFERFLQQDLSSRVEQPNTGHCLRFAQAIGVSPSLLSHLRGRRPMSDKVARQIEACVRAK